MVNLGKKVFFSAVIPLTMFFTQHSYGNKEIKRQNEIYVIQISPSDSQGYNPVTKIEYFKDGGNSFEKNNLQKLDKIKGKNLSFFLLGSDKDVGSLTIEDVRGTDKVKMAVHKGKSRVEDTLNKENNIILLVDVGERTSGSYYKIYSDLFTIKSIDIETNTAVIEAQEDVVIEYDFKEKSVESKPSNQAAYIKSVQASSPTAPHDSVLVTADKDNKKEVFVVKVLHTSNINDHQNLELNIRFLPREKKSGETKAVSLPPSWKVGSLLKDVTLFIDHYHPHHRHG